MKITTQTGTRLSIGVKIGFWLYICASLVAVFYIPSLISVKPAVSDSYYFGYNNHAGILLFIFLTFIGVVWARCFGLSFPLTGPSDRVHKKTLWTCMAVALSVCIFMYYLTSLAAAYGESAYFINRIELLSRGLLPYQNFEFGYGALLIYVPLLFSSLFSLGIPNAYYIFWILNVLAGVWLLSEVVNRIDYCSQYKNQIFILLFLAMLPGTISTGLNYTSFRFLIAPYLSLILFRSFREGTLSSQIKSSLLAVLFTLLLLLISPEIGVTFCIGVSSYFFLFYLRSESKRWLAPYLGMLLLFLFLMISADRLGVFSSLKSMGSGGYNFPLVPAAHILILFYSTFFAALYFITKLWHGQIQSNTILLFLVSLPQIPACMGRCDPCHVIFNGVGIFIVTLLCISSITRFWRWYRLSFILAIICLTAYSNLIFWGPSVRFACVRRFIRGEKGQSSLIDRTSYDFLSRFLVHRYGNTVARQKLDTLRLLAVADATDDLVMVPPQLKGITEVPFGYYVTHNPTSVDGGYYYATIFALDPESVKTKISELAIHPDRELLLSTDLNNFCNFDPVPARHLISGLFLYPYHGKVVHTVVVYKPLCDYINENYQLRVPAQPITYMYEIWSRK